MDLKKILTEAEYSAIPEEVVAKIEAAAQAEVAGSESAKQRKQVDKMLECVMNKADQMIGDAVAENVSKLSGNAINDKMYKVLKAMSACLESAGIGIQTNEATRNLQQKHDEAMRNLQKAYAELQHSNDLLNEQKKKNFLLNQVQGMKPEIAQKVIDHFMHYDIREIDRESIRKFIDGTSNDVYMADVDPDADGDIDVGRVQAALKEIDHELEMDHLGYDTKDKKGRFESLGKGLAPQRASIGVPEATFEAANPGNDDADVATAMKQIDAFASLGVGEFGGFS